MLAGGKNMRHALAFGVLAFLFAIPSAYADLASPVGRWRTFDDKEKREKSVVKIVEVDGKLQASIEKLVLKEGEDPNPVCIKCKGSRKDKPIIGMKILWGLTAEKDRWGGGYILDPENGKSYKSWIRVIDGGKKLEVRGYIGTSALGRTQYWIKADD